MATVGRFLSKLDLLVVSRHIGGKAHDYEGLDPQPCLYFTVVAVDIIMAGLKTDIQQPHACESSR